MEKCLKFLSENAYIISAIYGYNFIRSACKAMKLIICNAARAAAVIGVTGFVLLIGKLVTSVGLTLFAYYLFNTPQDKEAGAFLSKFKNYNFTTKNF
jgi:choline transporter-like protein 2/4/5